MIPTTPQAPYALHAWRHLLPLLLLCLGGSALAGAVDPPAPVAPVTVRLSIVKTGSREVPEAMMVSGGRWTHEHRLCINELRPVFQPESAYHYRGRAALYKGAVNRRRIDAIRKPDLLSWVGLAGPHDIAVEPHCRVVSR